MTYANRAHVKNKITPVRLDMEWRERLENLAEALHTQPAVLARDIVMERLEELERTYKKVLANHQALQR